MSAIAGLLTAIKARADGDTGAGGLFRLDPARGAERLWQSPSNFAVVGIAGSTGGSVPSVLVATLAEVFIFPGLPSTVSRVTATSAVNGEVRELAELAPGEALLLADRGRAPTPDRAVLRFPVSGQDGVRTVHSVPEVAALEALHHDPARTPSLFFAGGGRMFEGDLVSRRQVSMELPRSWSAAEVAGFDLLAIAQVGPSLLAVGERGAVFRRTPSGWVAELAPDGPEDEAWRDLAQVPGSDGDPEGYAVGRSGRMSRGSILRLYRGQFSSGGGAPEWDLVDLCFTGPDEAYAVGTYRSQARALVLRGTR